MKAVRLQVSGKVQGVYYRATTAAIAQELALLGWVKNEKDGSVTIYAQGPDQALDQLIAWAWQGPELARVTDVLVTEVEVTEVEAKDFLSFDVRY